STGFDERLFPKIRAVPGVRAAAPVVQLYARADFGGTAGGRVYRKDQGSPYSETLLVLGIDLFSERPFGRYERPTRAERVSTLEFLTDPRAVAITRAL